MVISNSGGGQRVGGLLALCKKELTQLPTFCIARYVCELVVEFFNISSCFCPLGLLFVTCRSSAALPLPPPSPPPAFCPSVAEPPCRTWEGLRSGNMPRGERERELWVKNCVVCLPSGRRCHAHVWQDHQQTQRWDGLTPPFLNSSSFFSSTVPPPISGCLLIPLQPLHTPHRPPSCGLSCKETNGASLISQSVNRDQDKASLSTSSPPWDWSIMTAYQLCLGLLAREGGKEGWVQKKEHWKKEGDNVLSGYYTTNYSTLFSCTTVQKGLLSSSSVLCELLRSTVF